MALRSSGNARGYHLVTFLVAAGAVVLQLVLIIHGRGGPDDGPQLNPIPRPVWPWPPQEEDMPLNDHDFEQAHPAARRAHPGRDPAHRRRDPRRSRRRRPGDQRPQGVAAGRGPAMTAPFDPARLRILNYNTHVGVTIRGALRFLLDTA